MSISLNGFAEESITLKMAGTAAKGHTRIHQRQPDRRAQPGGRRVCRPAHRKPQGAAMRACRSRAL